MPEKWTYLTRQKNLFFLNFLRVCADDGKTKDFQFSKPLRSISPQKILRHSYTQKANTGTTTISS
jgi:hypothetical protein